LLKFLVERQRETRVIWVHASSGPEQPFVDLDDRSFCLQQLAHHYVH
jgi:hypothetical protein